MRHDRRRAFSLLELLIAFAISIVALSIATQLLLEAHRRLEHESRRALDPAAPLAVKQLRADVRASSGAVGGDDLWSRSGLELRGHPAGRLRYEKAGQELVRILLPRRVEDEQTQRTVLTDVTTFRWRLQRLLPGSRVPLLEIELGYRETGRLGLLQGAAQRSAFPVHLTRRLLVVPRHPGAKRWW